MPPGALRPETPSGLSGRSDSGDGGLLQERLRLFGGLAFLITAAFYCISEVLAWLGRQPPPTPAGHASILAIMLLMGGTWIYCQSAARSEGILRAVDVLMLAMGTLVLVVMRGFMPEPDLRGMVCSCTRT